MEKKTVYGFIPVQVHRELKAKLAREGKTMQQFIKTAVKQYLKDQQQQYWQDSTGKE